MSTTQTQLPTLPLPIFWAWLKRHENCILRAGGPGFTLFDLPELHWRLFEEDGGLLVAQALRGKEIVSELVFMSEDILYVQSSPSEDDAILFDCVGQGPDGPVPMCYFLMAHGYEDEDEPGPPRWTH